MSLTVESSLARYTFRQVLARRRALALFALALIPILLAFVFRANQGGDGPPLEVFLGHVFGDMVVGVLLPIVALVIGTGVFGAEIEDGTALFVLAKPVARWRIVLVRVLVAGLATALLVAPATYLAGVLAANGADDRGLSAGFALAVAVGAFLYSAVFVALSLVTKRALVAGLGYVIVWEGMLSNLFAGTRILSVRQYALAVADAVSDASPEAFSASLPPGTAYLMTAVVLVAATLYAVRRLRVFEVGEAV